MQKEAAFKLIGQWHRRIENNRRMLIGLSAEERVAIELMLVALGNAYEQLDRMLNNNEPLVALGIPAEMPVAQVVVLGIDQLCDICKMAADNITHSADLIHVLQHPDFVKAFVGNAAGNRSTQIHSSPSIIVD